MARYTNFFMTVVPVNNLRQSLADVLKACDLTVIYEAADYLVAKEKPGQVTYNQLATVEVLINPSITASEQSTVNLVVKNEELPLKTNNHCHRVFQEVNQAISAASN